MKYSRLEKDILAAHEVGDMEALARLYAQAAEKVEADGAIDEACYYYTIAYVFALDAGLENRAKSAHDKLVEFGREE